MLARLLRIAVFGGCLLASPCPGQGLDDARDALRKGLQDVAFAQSFAGLVLAADDLELSGAKYRLDDAFDTKLSVLALPFRTTLRPWGASAAGLYLEGAVGYAKASSRVDDIYSGSVPGAETSVDAEWTTYGALGGVGVELEVASGLTFTPIVNFGVARIESDADYGGPGADFTRSLLDGIAFNWDAYTVNYGAAARAEWSHDLSPQHELDLRGRYDLRWSESFAEDDPAQEFSARLQVLTLRGDLVGPTGLTVQARPLRWRATVGYRRFLEGDFSGANDFAQIGGALELADAFSSGAKLSLSGAVVVGNDVDGWTLGLGVDF